MDIRKFFMQAKSKKRSSENDTDSGIATKSAVINDKTSSTETEPQPMSSKDSIEVLEFNFELTSKDISNKSKFEPKCESLKQNMEPVVNPMQLSTPADSAKTSISSFKSSSSSTNRSTDRSCFKHLHIGGKHYIVCEPCASHHPLLKQLSPSSNKKIPSIAQQCGALYREEIIEAHLQQVYHQEAVKVSRLESLDPADVLQSTAIGSHISKQNEALANKIGSLMLHIYCDAKKLTLSALTFPARVIVSHMANEFSFNSSRSSSDAIKNYDFQYLTPTFHLEGMKCIITSYREIFMKDLLENSLAISLRCDGSVDAFQIDKFYVMAKCVLNNGEVKELFLGAAEPEMRGAEGVLQCIKTACDSTLNCKGVSRRILEKASSLVTDGASVNIGSKNGLWELFKKEKSKIAEADAESCPFVTFWCAVHRTSLAWKQVTRDVPEVNNLITQLSSLSTFFHESGVRTRELKEIGEQEKLKVVHFPKYFEVRWAEFTENLFDAVLTNWLALTIYFEKNKESSKECAGYFNVLTKEENLKLITALADVLSVFSHYQKKLQANSTTIVDITSLTVSLKDQLNNLKTTNLVGGWVSTLNENLKNRHSDENTVQLHGITLQSVKPSRRKHHHLYVTDQRSSDAIINDLIEALKNFLDERLSLDDGIITYTSPFVTLQPDVQLPEVHKIWGPDLDLQELGLQYSDVMQHKDIGMLRRKTLKQLVEFFVVSENFHTLTVVMSRILAAKPHSADVERLISANNILKSSLRNRLNLETENLYLFTYVNMPIVEKWDPRAAVLVWLSDKKRRVRETHKARNQVWFKNIFLEASGVEEEEQEEEEKSKKNKKKAFVQN